ncbi:hypothetical protein BCR33DRAFT_735015 [Rhizoclosmatium globosum]|uniref:RRM domain-containing protein n=1 Tax=Rhizoclosmatium globosum TaxID=329046 RepID=A0A1Y2CRM0_9FUNG|nr:hypothetical protein BCR33DRAFT_735015 [Rhizoclosmatium globosum]|eukprot:ORY49586.1 hypothetical protein BCR33DRAFT_735015 [Rhizoclosmatium globosum]
MEPFPSGNQPHQQPSPYSNNNSPKFSDIKYTHSTQSSPNYQNTYPNSDGPTYRQKSNNYSSNSQKERKQGKQDTNAEMNPSELAQSYSNNGIQYATMQQQQQYYPYVYMYQSYNQEQGLPRTGSTDSINTRQNSSDSNQSVASSGMNPQSPMFFSPRTPPAARGMKTPLTSPLYQTPSNYNNSSITPTNLPPSAPPSSPYYVRGPTTPAGNTRRFQSPNIPSTPNNYAAPPPNNSYFMATAGAHPGAFPVRSPTPPSIGGSTARRSNESLNSPSNVRRPRRELSVSGASGVDWEVEGTSMTNLYIKGLKNTCTDEDLYEMCKVYGNIHSSKAILDLTTHECKGFGFVMYETMEESQFALNELSGLGYNVSFAKETFNTRLKNLQDEESTNVYVSNLPLEMDENGMLLLFAPHTIVSTKILRDPATQQSRGVGFARMDSRAAAQAIINEFNGRPLDNGQCLQVRFADSAAQKRFKQMQQGLQASPIRATATTTSTATGTFASPVARGGWRGDAGVSSGGVGVKVGGIPGGDLVVDAAGVAGAEIVSSEGVIVDDGGAGAALGYVTYYNGGSNAFFHSRMMMPAGYGYPVGPQGSGPQIMNGAYYYPPPPAAAPQGSVAPQQPALMYTAHPHHPYMVPMHYSAPANVVVDSKADDISGGVVAEAAEGDHGVEGDAVEITNDMGALRM